MNHIGEVTLHNDRTQAAHTLLERDVFLTSELLPETHFTPLCRSVNAGSCSRA